MQGDWIQQAQLLLGRFCWLAWHFVGTTGQERVKSSTRSLCFLQGLFYKASDIYWRNWVPTSQHIVWGKEMHSTKNLTAEPPITTGTQNWLLRLEPGSRVAYCASAYRPWNGNCNQHNIHIVIVGWGLIWSISRWLDCEKRSLHTADLNAIGLALHLSEEKSHIKRRAGYDILIKNYKVKKFITKYIYGWFIKNNTNNICKENK